MKGKNGKAHRFTDEEIDMIKEMANDPNHRYSIDDVANRLGIGRRVAHNKIINLRLQDKFANKRIVYYEEDVAEVIDICKTAKTKREASAMIRKRFPKMGHKTMMRYICEYNQDAIANKQQLERLNDVIKEYYPSGGPKKVSEILPNVTIDVIKARAAKLGIKHNYHPKQLKKYTDIIDKYYPVYGIEVIEKFGLPLTKSQVSTYAAKNNIRRIKPNLNDPKFVAFIKENIDESTEFLCQMILLNFGFSITKNAVNEIRKKIKKETQ